MTAGRDMRHARALAVGFLGCWHACSSDDAAPAMDARADAPLVFDAATPADAPLVTDAPPPMDGPARADATLVITCGPPPVNCSIVVGDAGECPSQEAFCSTRPACNDEIYTCCACAGSPPQVTFIECHTPCDAGVPH